MILGQLIDGGGKVEIRGIKTDSRKVERGDVFIAYRGVDVDGHDFIEKAIEKGAVTVVGEKELNLPISYIRVENGRLAWARMVARWYRNPEKNLRFVGVTGTDGKTTTTNLIYQILKADGRKVMMISTVFAMIGEKKIETGLHTSSPDPDEVWKLLDEAVKEGVTDVVLEVTSHALDQDRFGEIEFEAGVLTNFAHDHLDYHKTIENYALAKAKLFERSKISVLNGGANQLDLFRKSAMGKVVLYKGEEAKGIKTSLVGEYNRENIAAAMAVAKELGIRLRTTKKGIQKVKNLPGRFQEIKNDLGKNIIVDFAHTEQGIRNVLKMVRRTLIDKSAKIIVVFGCNGERDRTKRAPMGRTAIEFADKVVVTTEDPRRESVDQIFRDIEMGILVGGGRFGDNYFREDDRMKAIGMAIHKLAGKGDFVLCLGKGHEQSMNIGGVELPWNEAEMVKNLI